MMLAKISTELAEKKKTRLAWGGLMILKVGRKLAWIFNAQFYNNHLFVTVSLILILHLMFTSRFFNIGNPKWTPGMKKGKVYIWNRTLISGRVFPSKPLNTFPHALDTSLNLVELCLFYIFHTLGTSISCLCCYCFFLCQIKMSFVRYFLLQRSFHAIVPLQNYPVFPSRMTIPHQSLRGVACDIIYHFVTRRLKKLNEGVSF